MTSFKTKLALSAIGLTVLASPAFAQKPKQHPAPQSTQQTFSAELPVAPTDVGTYPNGAVRTGSAESFESGAEFNLLR